MEIQPKPQISGGLEAVGISWGHLCRIHRGNTRSVPVPADSAAPTRASRITVILRLAFFSVIEGTIGIENRIFVALRCLPLGLDLGTSAKTGPQRPRSIVPAPLDQLTPRHDGSLKLRFTTCAAIRMFLYSTASA